MNIKGWHTQKKTNIEILEGVSVKLFDQEAYDIRREGIGNTIKSRAST